MVWKIITLLSAWALMWMVVFTLDAAVGSEKGFYTRTEGRGDIGEVEYPVRIGQVPRAMYCATCHQESHREWRQALHANSFQTPFFDDSESRLIHAGGISSVKDCDNCHNPSSVKVGELTGKSCNDRGGDVNGISCIVCHSIQSVSTAGNGSYLIGAPSVMVDEGGNRISGEVPYGDILAYPERHRRAVMQDFYYKSEYCGTCHNADLSTSLTGGKFVREFNTFDEWQMSSYSGQNPLAFYPTPRVH
jgi:cytochrome c553